MIKILNLYAGIGGNRKLWHGDIEVTAVEYNEEIANIYRVFFPNDKIIVGDAHKYLEEHYGEFDFIWSSPPCPSHSDIRRTGVNRGLYNAIFPDYRLWQEILLLKHFAKGKWVIENVIPYYDPFILPSFILERHCFWANFKVRTDVHFMKREVSNLGLFSNSTINYGFDLRKYKIKDKRKILRNLVNPEIGLYLYEEAMRIEKRKFKRQQRSIFDLV